MSLHLKDLSRELKELRTSIPETKLMLQEVEYNLQHPPDPFYRYNHRGVLLSLKVYLQHQQIRAKEVENFIKLLLG